MYLMRLPKNCREVMYRSTPQAAGRKPEGYCFSIEVLRTLTYSSLWDIIYLLPWDPRSHGDQIRNALV